MTYIENQAPQEDGDLERPVPEEKPLKVGGSRSGEEIQALCSLAKNVLLPIFRCMLADGWVMENGTLTRQPIIEL